MGTELFGILSLSMLMNTLKAKKHVTANDIRSPEDAGSIKTQGLRILSRIGGINTFIIKYSYSLVISKEIFRYGHS
jgi:hypothetical protein